MRGDSTAYGDLYTAGKFRKAFVNAGYTIHEFEQFGRSVKGGPQCRVLTQNGLFHVTWREKGICLNRWVEEWKVLQNTWVVDTYEALTDLLEDLDATRSDVAPAASPVNEDDLTEAFDKKDVFDTLKENERLRREIERMRSDHAAEMGNALNRVVKAEAALEEARSWTQEWPAKRYEVLAWVRVHVGARNVKDAENRARTFFRRMLPDYLSCEIEEVGEV